MSKSLYCELNASELRETESLASDRIKCYMYIVKTACHK